MFGKDIRGAVSAADALTKANLNFNVSKRELFFKRNPSSGFSGELATVPEQFANVRDDSETSVGVVGIDYQIVQNRDAFNFMDIATREGQCTYEQAGELGGGSRVWVQAKLPSPIVIAEDEGGQKDTVERFILMYTSHDGSSKLKVRINPIRVVCQNTLTRASNSGDGISIRHSGDVEYKIREGRRAIAYALEQYSTFERTAKRMVARPILGKEAGSYITRLLANVEPDSKDWMAESTKIKNQADAIASLYSNGKGNRMNTTHHTLWSLYNGVTEYVDHHRSVRKTDETSVANSRLESIWFGSGANLKEKAWQLAEKML